MPSDQSEPERFQAERLSCRTLQAGDVALLFELDQDPLVMRFLTGGRPGTLADAEERIATSASWTWLGFAPDGEFVGWFSLRPSGPGERELGYRLRQAAWGRGYATEGSRRCLDLAFAALDADRVWAQTMTANVASRRVMEKIGLTYRRTFFGEWGESIPGSEKGDVEYELHRSEWERLAER